MCSPLLSLPIVNEGGKSLGYDIFGQQAKADKRAQEDQQNKWAREDQVRESTFAHEQLLADKGAYSGYKGKAGGTQTRGRVQGNQGNRGSLRAGGY